MTLESLGPYSRQAGLTERACRSPTHLTAASANCRAVLNESDLRLADCNGSNGGPLKALRMVGKSQGGTVRGRGGFILLAPRINWTTALFLPHRSTSNRGMKSRYMAEAETLMVDGECCLSSISCRNEGTTDTSEVTGSQSRS